MRSRTRSSRAQRGICTYACGLLALLGVTAASADAQRWGRMSMDGEGFFVPSQWAGNTRYDGRFTWARIKYRGNGHGAGWSHDYPRAETHFMNIIKAITSMKPFVESRTISGGNNVPLGAPDPYEHPVPPLSAAATA